MGRRESTLKLMVEEIMTLEQFDSLSIKHKDTILTNTEKQKIRNTPLYKGQLSYLKEIILSDCPDINPDLLAEKLDISYSIAQILLNDCQQK